MAINFSLDLSELKKAIDHSPELAGQGAQEALDAIKDDWVAEARDIAPLDSGNLRKQIKGQVQESGLNSSIMVTGNATNRSKSGGRFNYGYYIHELDAGGDELRTPGTEKQFLDKSVDEKKWQGYLNKTVLAKLRKLGWQGD